MRYLLADNVGKRSNGYIFGAVLHCLVAYATLIKDDSRVKSMSAVDLPLPIPNREVKPERADGTAMKCGRVGSRPLFYEDMKGLEKRIVRIERLMLAMRFFC